MPLTFVLPFSHTRWGSAGGRVPRVVGHGIIGSSSRPQSLTRRLQQIPDKLRPLLPKEVGQNGQDDYRQQEDQGGDFAGGFLCIAGGLVQDQLDGLDVIIGLEGVRHFLLRHKLVGYRLHEDVIALVVLVHPGHGNQLARHGFRVELVIGF